MRLLLIAFCFLSLSASAQKVYYEPNDYGRQNLRAIFDSALFFPTGCGAPTSIKSIPVKRFAIYGDSCNNLVYFYNPKLATWAVISGASLTNGSGTTVSGSKVDLGGTLTGDVLIRGSGNQFEIVDTSSIPGGAILLNGIAAGVSSQVAVTNGYSVTIGTYTSANPTYNSALEIYRDSIGFSPWQGNIVIDTLLNRTNQDKLVGWVSGDGRLGNVGIGSGLSLSGGSLSATGAALDSSIYSKNGTLQGDRDVTGNGKYLRLNALQDFLVNQKYYYNGNYADSQRSIIEVPIVDGGILMTTQLKTLGYYSKINVTPSGVIINHTHGGGSMTEIYVTNNEIDLLGPIKFLTTQNGTLAADKVLTRGTTALGGEIHESSVTGTELGYLSGVTSAIQTQINAKGAGTVTSVARTNGYGISASVASSTTTPNITIALDSSVVFPAIRATIPSGGGSGTVTSVVAGRGLNTNTITTSGTLTVDTTVIAKKVDVQVFTSTATWTKPAGAKSVKVECIAGGTGGSSGAKAAAGVSAVGGSGGGGGGYSEKIFNAADLTATVYCSVGTGGAGGASQTTNSTVGIAGSAGIVSYFGDYLRANAGSGVTGGTGLTSSGGNGGAGSGSTFSSGASGTFGPLGGGSGGAVSTGNVAATGGNGSNAGTTWSFSPAASAVTGGSAGGGAGTTASSYAPNLSYGGGGGGASTGGNGGAGSVGGTYGGGGGGGGSARDGVGNSGAGGAGGNGVVIVTTYF